MTSVSIKKNAKKATTKSVKKEIIKVKKKAVKKDIKEKKVVTKTTIKKSIKTDSKNISVKKITTPTLIPLNEKLINTIIDAIKDIKGEKIVTIDLRKLTERFTDFFIICEATTNTQLQGIAGNIEAKVKEKCGEKTFKRTSEKESLWMFLDYINVVVHLFLPEQRAFYNLEECWSDGIINKLK